MVRADGFQAVRHPDHSARDHDIMSESGTNSQICLECAAILGHLAVNDPVSAWGLYKGDDDQAHSDHFGDRGGWHGGNFTRAGAGLSAAPGIHLFPRPQLPARRLSGRLSRRARSGPGFRRAGRRPVSARPGFHSAVAARSHSVARRSALRPPRRRASGLYRSRGAARTDHVPERSALRPSRWTAAGDLFGSSRRNAASLFGSRQ